MRFISNRSSGKMGYAIAEAARDRGAKAVLVAAPTALPDPVGVVVTHTETALEMREAILDASADAIRNGQRKAAGQFLPDVGGTRDLRSDHPPRSDHPDTAVA